VRVEKKRLKIIPTEKNSKDMPKYFKLSAQRRFRSASHVPDEDGLARPYRGSCETPRTLDPLGCSWKTEVLEPQDPKPAS